MDLPDCSTAVSLSLVAQTPSSLTAYAIRSPLGSDERGVGCPRVVVGDAAQTASAAVKIRYKATSTEVLLDTRDMAQKRKRSKQCKGGSN